jgi:hypothetical protein
LYVRNFREFLNNPSLKKTLFFLVIASQSAKGIAAAFSYNENENSSFKTLNGKNLFLDDTGLQKANITQLKLLIISLLLPAKKA